MGVGGNAAGSGDVQNRMGAQKRVGHGHEFWLVYLLAVNLESGFASPFLKCHIPLFQMATVTGSLCGSSEMK